MKFTVFAILLSFSVGMDWAMAQQRTNPRPVERPSRTVEELLKRQEAAKEAARREEEAKAKPTEPAAEAVKAAEKAAPAVFKVAGAEAWQTARQAGWKFFPKGASGALDGVNTVADVQPGVAYSSVQGPVLTQRRTPAGWGVISQNTFFLFTDARGRARSLAPGWTVRDLRLSGDPFQWVLRPQPGGASPSLAIQLAGGRGARDSVVRLEELVLQGPGDARDWREAFAGR